MGMTVKVDVLNLEKLKAIIVVLKKWAEDEKIPFDARQEMVDTLNDVMREADSE